MSEYPHSATTVLPEARGGDITLTAGKGSRYLTRRNGPPIDGKISFNLPDGTEAMRIEPNGDFFVNGKLVANDVDAHQGFVNWLRSAGFHL